MHTACLAAIGCLGAAFLLFTGGEYFLHLQNYTTSLLSAVLSSFLDKATHYKGNA
jgi:hypothetical protein